MTAVKIILASTSVTRRNLLTNAGLDFTSSAPHIDETAAKASLVASGTEPRDIAAALAAMKALDLSRKEPDALVIGADQILQFDGGFLDKPTSISAARAQLLALRGRQHMLISAVAVASAGRVEWHHIGQARLKMRDFSDLFLDSYLEQMGSDILTTVGCYKLEQQGVGLFSKIEGDYFTVLGLPLVDLLNYLFETGTLEK